jgi:UDP-glucose 4-epimerase
MDLAEGHVAALNHISQGNGLLTVNLGTGRGHSVLEIVMAFEKATSRSIPYQIAARRPGDIAAYYADASKSYQVLNWRAVRNLEQMCTDAWRWQNGNPNGYST